MELKIRDNSSINKEKFNEISNLTRKISDKTLEQLEKEGVFVFPELIRESDDLTREQMILQSLNEDYISSNIMGYLGYKEEKLIIKSRFANGNKDYLFKYLLEKVIEFPNFIELSTDLDKDNRLFDFLIFLFPYYLKRAMRKGIYKIYIENKYNDINLKGKIDINRHIQKNTPFVGNIAYNVREFSYDNYIIELIRHTIELIKKKSYGNKLLRKSKEEVAYIIETTAKYQYHNRRKIIIENKKNPIKHSYYTEYRDLQRLCIMILEYKEHDIGHGIDEFHGVLFDGAWLWEEYINTLLSEKFYHPKNKSRIGSQHLFTTNNRKTGLIYPDFISIDDKNRIIADAKYKPVENIRNRDYLQVLAYMFRFDAKKGYYIYPEKNEIENQKLYLNKGTNYENNIEKREDISLIKCGLKIPKNSKSYEEFVEEIKNSEKVFLSNFS